MLAQAWADDAREEHASIAAFARFTMLLLSVGAPPDMVRDSQRASLDEIEHARACLSLALRYGAVSLGPTELDLTGTLEPLSLTEIAVLTAEEGCVGETFGVALAVEQAERARDPMVRRVLARIVRDEARHTQLAWEFVAWAAKRGGRTVSIEVEAAVRRAVGITLEMPIKTYRGVNADAWRAHGRCTCTEAREVARRTAETVVFPGLAQIAAAA